MTYQAIKQAHAQCMVCAPAGNNPDSLQLSFQRDGEQGVSAVFDVLAKHQGYNGILHGGMTSTLLDAAMTHCLFMQGITALTAELQVRFVAPIPVGIQASLSARLTAQKRGVYQLEGCIFAEEKIFARGRAKFIQGKQAM